MYVRPTQPRSIGGVLDDAFRLYRSAFLRCLPLSLLGALLMGAFGVYMAQLELRAGIANQQIAPMARLAQLATLGPKLGLWNVLMMLVSMLIYAALITQLNAVFRAESESIGAALSLAVRRLPRVLLMMVVVTGAAAVCMVVCAVVWRVLPGGRALGALAACVLLIAALYVSLRLMYSFVAIYVEDATAIQSFGISWRLVGGHWWRNATILTVIGIILIVLSLVGGIITGITAGVTKTDLSSMLIVGQVTGALVNVILISLIPAALIAIYHDLKLRREGVDLGQRLSALPTV